ncbi:histone Octamer, chromosomal Protein, alpha carbons only, partial [Mycena filopes]
SKPGIRPTSSRLPWRCVSGLISPEPETRNVFGIFLWNVIRDSVIYTEHANRYVVTALDGIYAPKRSDRTLHGFGGLISV